MYKQYILKYFDGSTDHKRYVHATNYSEACAFFKVSEFPPAYIWSVEPYATTIEEALGFPDEPNDNIWECDWVKGWDNIDKCNTNRRKIRAIVPQLLNTMHEQDDSRILEKFYNDLDNMLTKWKATTLKD